MSGSVLGPAKKRIKTDVRLPVTVTEWVDWLCFELQIQKNVFFTLAAVRLVTDLSPFFVARKKRAAYLREIEEFFQKLFDEVKKAA